METDETIWKSPLSTNPPISEQYFDDPPLRPNFKNKNLRLVNLGGKETMNSN